MTEEAMNRDINALAAFCGKAGIKHAINEPMRGHCSFMTGGPAGLFIEPFGAGEIAGTLKAAKACGARLFVLGNGTNVLFSDVGFNGAVMHVKAGLDQIRLVDETTIECQSGASMQALARFALEAGLSGLEFAYGIPGSVGGAVAMNAGAYGGEIKDRCTLAHHISSDGKPGSFTANEATFSYRHSAYRDNGYVITGAVFALEKGEKAEIKAKMEDFMRRRREKQPLELPSAGSTFKRPIGGYASELIDRCGLKGKRFGGAMVSEKHAGFVVNAGGATSADILALIAEIQRIVNEKTGILLEPEVKIVEC
jgi:UDP-N-acetylmuramate dehydrogenase